MSKSHRWHRPRGRLKCVRMRCVLRIRWVDPVPIQRTSGDEGKNLISDHGSQPNLSKNAQKSEQVRDCFVTIAGKAVRQVPCCFLVYSACFVLDSSSQPEGIHPPKLGLDSWTSEGILTRKENPKQKPFSGPTAWIEFVVSLSGAFWASRGAEGLLVIVVEAYDRSTYVVAVQLTSRASGLELVFQEEVLQFLW